VFEDSLLPAPGVIGPGKRPKVTLQTIPGKKTGWSHHSIVFT